MKISQTKSVRKRVRFLRWVRPRKSRKPIAVFRVITAQIGGAM